MYTVCVHVCVWGVGAYSVGWCDVLFIFRKVVS